MGEPVRAAPMNNRPVGCLGDRPPHRPGHRRAEPEQLGAQDGVC